MTLSPKELKEVCARLREQVGAHRAWVKAYRQPRARSTERHDPSTPASIALRQHQARLHGHLARLLSKTIRVLKGER